MEYQTGDNFDAGGSFKIPGRYHLIVDYAEENPTDRNGQPRPDVMYEVGFKIVGAANPAHVDKKIDQISFFAPKGTEKDGGVFIRKKSDRFLLAVNLLQPDDIGKSKSINLAQAAGQQLCAEFALSEKGYMQIAFANIYHVDDPEAADIPKNEKLLTIIDPSCRRVGQKPASASTTPAAATAPINLDEI